MASSPQYELADGEDVDEEPITSSHKDWNDVIIGNQSALIFASQNSTSVSGKKNVHSTYIRATTISCCSCSGCCSSSCWSWSWTSTRWTGFPRLNSRKGNWKYNAENQYFWKHPWCIKRDFQSKNEPVPETYLAFIVNLKTKEDSY